MNIQALLDNLTDLRIAGTILFVFFLTGIFFGYNFAPKPLAKALICKNEIEQLNILNSQMESLRLEHLNDIARIQKESVKLQEKLCTDKIKKYRQACLSLKCEICEASK